MNPARELKKIAAELEQNLKRDEEVEIHRVDSKTIEMSGLPEYITNLALESMETADDTELGEELEKTIRPQVQDKYDPDLIEDAFETPLYVVYKVEPGKIIWRIPEGHPEL